MTAETLPDRTWALVERAVAPKRFHPSASCYLYAVAAQAALRGTGARFAAGGAFLSTSTMTGWGLIINPAGRNYYLTADKFVDAEDDGAYCGHCWVELGRYDPLVVDLMDGYVGRGKDFEKPVIYHPIPSLARSIRAYHDEAIHSVMTAVRRDTEFCAEVRALAGIS